MIYCKIIKSKTNDDIPLFNNGKSMHSKYDPKKEAQTFGEKINDSSKFTIILGLGGGYHIKSFIDKNPDHKVFVIENSIDDINFLLQIECVKDLKNNPNVIFVTKDKLKATLLQNYLPAIYGGINILNQRAWYENNTKIAEDIIAEINSTLKLISQDYSVQSHFGFIWQKNIISNLKIASNLSTKNFSFDTNKKAAIIAAGPSLDSTIKKLIQNRNDYFIISTDTALSTLSNYKVITDAVISIDGQNVSTKHFTGFTNNSTIFIFDLQANFNAVNYVANFSDNIIFTKSGHPFSNYAEQFYENNNFMTINCGAGTVTIAAIDFAKNVGFNNFEVFGADFSYINNKPYAKGTYLDFLYRKDESKLNPAENLFTNLLYRTKINSNKNIITTEVLNNYKNSFIEWLKNNNLNYEYSDLTYKIKTEKKFPEKNVITTKFNFNNLKSNLIEQNQNLKNEQFSLKNNKEIITSLLPYISYLRINNKELSFSLSVKLAMSKILMYT